MGKKTMDDLNPIFHYDLYMKPNMLDIAMKAKGFERINDLAKAMQITPQYLSTINTGHAPVSPLIITRLAVLLNNLNGGWWHFYEFKPSRDRRYPNHKGLNMAKYRGEVPYTDHSPDGKARESEHLAGEIKNS